MVVEAAIGILLLGVLVAAELAAWRLLRGPAHGPRGAALRAALLSLLTAALLLASLWRLTKSRRVQLCGRLVARVETSERVVALTFDDGPQPAFTDEVLAILRAEGVRATFFVTGDALAKHMAEARSLVAEGHELGNHTYSHQAMVGVSYAFVRQELERTDELIRAAGYTGAIHFRPPYSKRFVTLPYYLARTQRNTIFMDVEPESYPAIAADAGKITEHVLARARPGSIILLHVMYESRAESRKALPAIIRGLRGRAVGHRLGAAGPGARRHAGPLALQGRARPEPGAAKETPPCPIHTTSSCWRSWQATPGRAMPGSRATSGRASPATASGPRSRGRSSGALWTGTRT